MTALTPFHKEPEEPIIQIDTPVNLRPDLTLHDIQEIDRGVCEDSYENRAKLRKAHLSWVVVYSENGLPTGQIQALSTEMVTARSMSSLEDRKAILVDPDDPNSDYLSGLQLLLATDAEYLVPPWVIRATREYDKIVMRREAGENVKSKLESPPTRCRAIKSDRIRCLLWSSGPNNDGLCRIHLGSILNHTGAAIERARNRIHQAAPAAVDELERLLNSAESEPVRLNAARDLLDRAGIRAGFEIDSNVNVEVRPAGDIVAERLAKLAEGHANIQQMLASRALAAAAEEETVDAEVVEDGDTES